jgi:DNA-binding transcriptional LysR family regulator
MDKAFSRIGQLRLRDLLLLEQIDAHGTLRKVAELMHVTQPAVTQALQGLERAFGVELVERGRRGVRLTEAGHAAATHLRAAGAELLAAREAALAPEAPMVRLGTSPLASLDALPKGIAKLHKAEPAMRVVITEGSVPQLWAALADGSLDAILTRFPGRGEGSLRAVHYHVVGSERLVLAAPRAHAVARRTPDIAMLARHPWVMPPPGSLATTMFEEWFAQEGMQPPDVAITSTSFHSNLALASACGMLTLAPETSARANATALRMKIIATPWEHKRGDIVFACRASSLAQPVMQAVRQSFEP